VRKFNYVQIICLYGFQILFVCFFLSKVNDILESKRLPGILRHVLPSDKNDSSLFSGPSTIQKWKREKKRFFTVYLTGDVNEDRKRFEVIKYEARRVKYTCDTNTIIKVHFCNDNTYGQFVQLINMMIEDKHHRYMFYQDDFYIADDPCVDLDLSVIESKPIYIRSLTL
jgi:hypothetical protein